MQSFVTIMRKKSFKPCLHSATHFCKLPQRPTVPQPALQAGGSHRVTRHIGFRNENGSKRMFWAFPCCAGADSRGIKLRPHAAIFPPRGPSAGHQQPSRPFGLRSLTQYNKSHLFFFPKLIYFTNPIFFKIFLNTKPAPFSFRYFLDALIYSNKTSVFFGARYFLYTYSKPFFA